MPHAAARVGRVAVIARDHMDVRMEDRLPGAAPAVEPDVDAGRMVAVQQILPHPLHQLPTGGLLVGMHQEVLGHMAPRDHQSVPFRHRIRIRYGERQAMLDDLRCCRGTKRASGGTTGRAGRRCRFIWGGCGQTHNARYTKRLQISHDIRSDYTVNKSGLPGNELFQAYSLSSIKLIDTKLDFFFLLVSELIPKILILFFKHASEFIDYLLIILSTFPKGFHNLLMATKRPGL